MNYLKSLERAIIYIENNLGDIISLEDVARETGYSYYHLTRLFTAILGESVGSYIKKRRLTDAAKKLLYTDKKVIDIALECGFDSPEAFSRTFKATYHQSPIIYRKNRLDLVIGNKKQLDINLIEHLSSNITVKPKIVKISEGITVVGIRGETTLKDNIVPQLWTKFHKMKYKISNVIPRARYLGICETSETAYTMNGDVTFSEVVSIEVSNFNEVPDNMVKKVIGPGKYAVFTHKGSLKNLRQTYDYIWGTWFLATKEKITSGEDFELYDERFFDFDNSQNELDIYVPIK